jgi:hypothetical protein
MMPKVWKFIFEPSPVVAIRQKKNIASEQRKDMEGVKRK